MARRRIFAMGLSVAIGLAACGGQSAPASTTAANGAHAQLRSVQLASCANYPTLQPGYHVTASEPAGAIARGDFVLFNSSIARGLAVFRVVGLGGEQIRAASGHLIINGQPLVEPYLPSDVQTRNFGLVAIPSGSYFLMGDNRSNAADSRALGPIAKSAIVGRIIAITKDNAPSNGIQPRTCAS